ncbi:chloride channel CLIC-like protein 1 [Oncorhynchus tshawytscha]|uniref:Chloride channel CLIC-like protein 1 n=2 Tax=Oncorhynchus tshawytscha TaxID=74940 RepID=A0AAZ3QSL9_ONCTS|nr:chloride channel CLIC-like protein 1 [Oncorhynchus tshawytscha]
MKTSTSAVVMHIFTVAVCSLLLVAQGQMDDDEWLDPHDMLNYDASSKTMRKPAQPAELYPNVPTKRREYSQDLDKMEVRECNNKVEGLQREIEEYKKKITQVAQQPSSNPVFKRFLTKLLKEIEKVGLPTDVKNDIHYDAKVKLSRQAVTEIRKLLEGMDTWRTGALDNALSQILVDLKPHDYEAWIWHFEDTFGVEIDTVMKVSVWVLIIVVIICSELWSTVSWFVQFKRIFAICFFISLVWNWFYLYKIAFAEHQNKMVKMEGVDAKCTGRKKIDWWDNLKDWYRGAMTLQDDPCKMYYEVLMVNPILLVPPTKAITMTITTFFTEPLKHIGQGISEFLRALLKDLPVTLQIPVLVTIVLSILVFMYGSAQAAIQHGITRPLRVGGPRDPSPPALDQPMPEDRLRGTDRNPQAGGDAPQYSPLPLKRRLGPAANQGAQDRTYVGQRSPPPRAQKEPTRRYVETLRNTDWRYSEDKIISECWDDFTDAVDTNPLTVEGNTNIQADMQEEPVEVGSTTEGNDSQEAKPSPAKVKPDEDVASDSKGAADSMAEHQAEYTGGRASPVHATPASGLGHEQHDKFLKHEPESNFTLQTHPANAASVAGFIDNIESVSVAAQLK